jgi:hypothetical protein
METAPEHWIVRLLLRWLPVALWAAVIFTGSSVPGTNIPGGYSVYGHLGEYFVLGALTLRAVRREDRGTVLLALALCALYGASDEFHQAFVPFRVPDPVDWLTDVVGAAVGVSAYLWWALRRGRDAVSRQ